MCILRFRSTVTLALAVGSLLLALPTPASALMVTRQSPTSCDSFTALTDWSHNLQLPKFSAATGNFVSATVTQSVDITSAYKVESRDGAPRTISLSLEGASVTSSVPGFSSVSAFLPAGNRTYAFTAFDGVVDFAGSSGAAGGFGTGQEDRNEISTNDSIWVGEGFLVIPASSIASTTQSQSGNLRLEWDTQSAVRTCVTYTYEEQVLVCVGDYVWHDSDKNGIQDSSEEAVPGRPVQVLDAQGTVLSTTTTDEKGRWIACGLEPSTVCTIEVGLPDGWVVTGVDKGTDNSLDSDGVATSEGSATIPCITPPTGSDLTFDVGIYRAEVPVEQPAPVPGKVAVTKRAGAKVISSRQRVHFVVRVSNRGQLAIRNVRVCDAPPAQLAFTSKPRGAVLKNGQLCWSIRVLQPHKTVTYRYTMRAANVAARQCVLNRATALATIGGSAAAKAALCIRATKLGVLQLAG